MLSTIFHFLLLQSVVSVDAARSSGCGKKLPSEASPGGSSYSVSIVSNDVERDYLIHIPPSYAVDQPAPLIFSFHGRTKNAASQELLSRFSENEFNKDAIAIYPNGTLLPSGNGRQWQGDPDLKGVDDVQFVADMIKSISADYCIDTSRIYASGKSNGGGFTNILACDPDLSKQIAAFAVVSGAVYTDTSVADCNPKTVELVCDPGRGNIPIIDFHGSADTQIPYWGGGGKRNVACLPSVPHWAREWSKRQGYGKSNETSELDGGVTLSEFGGEQKRGLVSQYLVAGLNHSWPSLEPNSDNPAGSTIEATKYIMAFFGKYSLP